jgi:hypothetical protein
MPDKWRDLCGTKLITAAEALKAIRPGNRVFIGSACGEPQELVRGMTALGDRLEDTEVIHVLTLGVTPYAEPKFAPNVRPNAFFVGNSVRDAVRDEPSGQAIVNTVVVLNRRVLVRGYTSPLHQDSVAAKAAMHDGSLNRIGGHFATAGFPASEVLCDESVAGLRRYAGHVLELQARPVVHLQEGVLSTTGPVDRGGDAPEALGPQAR